MERIQNLLLPALVELLRSDGQNIRGVYLRNDVALREKEGLPQNKGWFPLPGEASPDSAVTEITENGVRYLVDVENGQKNRLLPGPEVQPAGGGAAGPGADGAGLLHPHRFLCLNAARGGKSTSPPWTCPSPRWKWRANAVRNGLDAVMTCTAVNVFDLLPQLERESSPYDLIILDPPAFTKSRKTVDNAMAGYREINYRAMRLLPRGGLLATCSCSHFATEERFTAMLREAARMPASSCGRLRPASRAATTPFSGVYRRPAI